MNWFQWLFNDNSTQVQMAMQMLHKSNNKLRSERWDMLCENAGLKYENENLKGRLNEKENGL